MNLKRRSIFLKYIPTGVVSRGEVSTESEDTDIFVTKTLRQVVPQMLCYFTYDKLIKVEIKYIFIWSRVISPVTRNNIK